MKTAEEFLKGLSTYHEIFHINDDPEYSEEQTIQFAKEYADHVSTSQQQTIERLRERLRLAENYIKASPCDPDITIEQSKAWNEYKEFLSTTEPIDQ